MDFTLSKVWDEYNKQLESINIKTVDDILKSELLDKFILFPISANNDLVRLELHALKEHMVVEKEFNVLEIGAGIGNYCKLFRETYEVNSYTILDLESMLKISQVFLDSYKIPYTPVGYNKL